MQNKINVTYIYCYYSIFIYRLPIKGKHQHYYYW